MHLGRCALALVCVLAFGCERGAPEPSSDQSSSLAPLDAKAAADAKASVEFGPPQAHPELALRALAELERQRLGPSMATGFADLVDAPPDSRTKHAARTIAANMKLLDTACGSGGEALVRELEQIEASRRAQEIWSRCRLERFGLLSAPEATHADPTTLLLVHMAYAKLSTAGELDANERALLELALRFGSSQASSAEPTPDPITHPCVALAAKFDRVLESADPSCETDLDCSCSPGGVSEKAGCGRVTSTATAKELGEIYAEFRESKCSLVRHCAPRRCEAKCVEGRCR